MKIVLIICVFVAIFDSVKTRSSDFMVEPKAEPKNETHTLPRGKTEISHSIKHFQRSLISSHQSTSKELDVNNDLIPKIKIKDSSEENNNSHYVSTTRRPIMKKRTFTSKPHAIHYTHSRTHGEQSNFSKRRNLNAKKRFKSQNNKKNTSDISAEGADSVEDRFRNFTDISHIDELGEKKRNVFKLSQLNSRRGNPLATAASEHINSVAFHSSLITNTKLQLKSKLAIQESLQKIRRIRPGMKEKAITPTDYVLTKIKNNIETSTTILVKKTEENKINRFMTSEKSVPLTKTTEKSIYSATITEGLVNSANKNYSVTKTDNFSFNVVEKLNDNRTKIEKNNNFTTTTENLNNFVIHTKKSFLSGTTTEKFYDSVIKTEKPVHPADILETSYKSDSGTEKSVPFIIITGKSLSLSDMNDTIENIAKDNLANLEEKVDPNNFTITKEENIVTVTPVPNEDEVKTTQHSALRRKRRINVIEEERVATTSTRYRFNERGTPMMIDFTFRNIHT